MDVDKAIQSLQAQATNSDGTPKTQSQTSCAVVIRKAIQAGGVSLTAPYPHYAKDYGTYLEDNGFADVPANGYVPEKGDVAVIQPFPAATHQWGHVAMWDGSQWISDYFQQDVPRTPYPGSHYINAQPPLAYYRP
jgi:type VI secretion system secreted protein VgrG